jgi:RimJ/RimL family protein N-acetyltransferase
VVNGANDPRRRFYFADRYWDDVYYGLLKDEWRV